MAATSVCVVEVRKFAYAPLVCGCSLRQIASSAGEAASMTGCGPAMGRHEHQLGSAMRVGGRVAGKYAAKGLQC
jgi:hypothetical protein